MGVQTKTSDRAVEVVVMWGDESVLHVEHLSPPRSFRIGDGADYLIGEDSLGFDVWPIVTHEAEQSRVVLPEGASFEVARGGVLVPQAELELRVSGELPGARELVLSRDLAVRVSHRGFSFLVRDLPSEPVAKASVLAGMDVKVKEQRWTFASAAAHALLVLGFYFLPPPSTVCSIDLLNTDSRLVKYAILANTLPPPPPSFLDADTHEGGKDSRAAEKDAGKVGTKNPKRDCQDCKPKAAPSPKTQLTRQDLKDLATKAGVIGILNAAAAAVGDTKSQYAAINAITGDQDQQQLALAGLLDGSSLGGGLAMLGTGVGGGGEAKGTIGVGRLGTIGSGPGGNGYGTPSTAGLPPHTYTGPVIHPKPPEVRGGLSKEVIRRGIGLHMNEVRHCYEQALTSRPELQGRVVVQFMISPSGAVSKAFVKENELGSSTVAQCIADTIGRAIFPAPDGGGLVLVSYPFVLQQVGN